MPHEQIDTVLRIATAILTNNPEPTREDVHDAVKQAMRALPDLEVTELQLLEEAERVFDVFVPRQTVLEDRTGHEPWLPAWKAEHEWRFWRRYRTLLEDRYAMPPRVVRRLDEVTDEILALLEDPRRPGPWDRRGMVVGQVQSGKTSNYIGLLSKGADAGYRLLIVLAGLHNSLRSQTQLRVDEGLLGYDTRQRMNFDLANLRMGVGQLPGFPFEQYIVQTLTNSSETGDF